MEHEWYFNSNPVRGTSITYCVVCECHQSMAKSKEPCTGRPSHREVPEDTPKCEWCDWRFERGGYTYCPECRKKLRDPADKKYIKFDDCPFCGEKTTFDEIKPTFDELQYVCGCDTLTCRGYIKESPRYYKFDVMVKRWNKRPGDGVKAPYI